MDYEMVEHNTTLREKKFILFSVKKKKKKFTVSIAKR